MYKMISRIEQKAQQEEEIIQRINRMRSEKAAQKGGKRQKVVDEQYEAVQLFDIIRVINQTPKNTLESNEKEINDPVDTVAAAASSLQN